MIAQHKRASIGICCSINRFANEGAFKAVEYGEKSLAIARELGMTEQIALTLKDLNVTYVVVGKSELAMASVPEVIALWRQLNNIPMLAEVLGGSSQSFFAQGKLDESIQMGEESYLPQSIDWQSVWLEHHGSFFVVFLSRTGTLETSD